MPYLAWIVRECDGEMIVRDGVREAQQNRTESIAEIQSPPDDASFCGFCVIVVEILIIVSNVQSPLRNHRYHHLSHRYATAITQKPSMRLTNVQVDLCMEDGQHQTVESASESIICKDQAVKERKIA